MSTISTPNAPAPAEPVTFNAIYFQPPKMERGMWCWPQSVFRNGEDQDAREKVNNPKIGELMGKFLELPHVGFIIQVTDLSHSGAELTDRFILVPNVSDAEIDRDDIGRILDQKAPLPRHNYHHNMAIRPVVIPAPGEEHFLNDIGSDGMQGHILNLGQDDDASAGAQQIIKIEETIQSDELLLGKTVLGGIRQGACLIRPTDEFGQLDAGARKVVSLTDSGKVRRPTRVIIRCWRRP